MRTITTQSLDWQADAACQSADPDAFFPDGPEDAPAVAAQIERVRQICLSCPVRRECLEYAVAARAPGVWGGSTEDERAAARHQVLLERRRARPRAAV